MNKKRLFIIVFISALLATQSIDQVKAANSGLTDHQSNAAQENQADIGKSNVINSDAINQAPSRPMVKQGWITKSGKKIYYYSSNRKATGLVKIKNYHYLFNKHGILLTGLRKTPCKSSYSYYLPNGPRSEKSIVTKKAYYWIRNGNVVGVKNKVKCISQKPELPTGCEMTATAMMINFAGHKVSKLQIANETPRSKDPNKGFVGSPYKEYPAGYWIAPAGLKSLVKKYLGTAEVMTNCSLTAIKKKLLHSHLVVVWVCGMNGLANHALTLTGYHHNVLFYNDPWTGHPSSMSNKNFVRYWRRDGCRALSY